MLACYLDDSDAVTSRVLTIAGYVADEDGWRRFEALAEQVCDSFNVEVIHGVEFERNHLSFKGWSVPRKIEFLYAVRDAMIGNVLFGISRSIPKEIYKQQKARLGLDQNTGAYCFAFRTIVHSLLNEDEFGLVDRFKNEGFSFRVEAGHKNNTDLERYVAEQVNSGNLHERTSISSVDKRSCRGVQLADLYAYYSHRKVNRWDKTKGKLTFFPDPLALHIQPVIPHYTGVIEEPYRLATVPSTGQTFQVLGIVTSI